METAEVQQKAAALSSQFRTLAQDFRGIDPAGGYQRVIDLAGYGAKLCKRAYDAGLLVLTRYKREVALFTEWGPSPQEDLQSWIRDLLLKEYGEIPDQPLDALNELVDQRLDERKMWPNMDVADMWAGTWRSIVSHLSKDHPDELPCNPFVTTNNYDWYFRGRFQGEAKRKAKTEWRSLAQNYAMVADWLAEHLEAGGPAAKRQRPKRRRRKADAKPLTAKQTEAVEAYADFNGDIPKAAKRCGISPRSMRDRLEGAWKKIGERPTLNAIKAKTRPLPTDKRGQEVVFSNDEIDDFAE